MQGQQDTGSGGYWLYDAIHGTRPSTRELLTEEKRGLEMARNVPAQLGKTVTRMAASPVDFGAALLDAFGQDGAANYLRSKTNAAVEGVGEALGQSHNPDVQANFFSGTLPQAIGSSIGLAGVGAGLQAARVVSSAAGAVGLAGALQGGAQQFYDAKAHGADDATSFLALLGGSAAGATERFGVASNILARLDRASGGLVRRTITTAALEATEEGAQEVLQGGLSNLTALLYDDERKVLDGLGEQGLAGAVVGALLGGGSAALGGGHTAVDLPPQGVNGAPRSGPEAGPEAIPADTIGPGGPENAGSVGVNGAPQATEPTPSAGPQGEEVDPTSISDRDRESVSRFIGATEKAPHKATLHLPQGPEQLFAEEFLRQRGARVLYVKADSRLERPAVMIRGEAEGEGPLVLLDANNPKEAFEELALHEAVHVVGEDRVIAAIQQFAPELIDEAATRYEERAGVDLTPEQRQQEGAAQLAQDLPNLLRRFLNTEGSLEEAIREDRTFAQRVLDWVSQILQRLRIPIAGPTQRRLAQAINELARTPTERALAQNPRLAARVAEAIRDGINVAVENVAPRATPVQAVAAESTAVQEAPVEEATPAVEPKPAEGSGEGSTRREPGEGQAAGASTSKPQDADERFAAPLLTKDGNFAGIDENRSTLWRRRFVNYFQPVEDVQRATVGVGKLTPDQLAINEVEALHYGKITKAKEAVEKVAQRIKRIADREGIAFDDLGDYLLARHAPTRNAIAEERSKGKFGLESNPGSGRTSKGVPLTNSEAARIVNKADFGPKGPAYQRIADIVHGLNQQTRQRLYEGGLISAEELDAWETQFGPEYVPMRSAERQGGAVRFGARKFGVKGKESKRAEGRSSAAGNPIVWSLEQAVEAAERVERNKVGQTAGRVVEKIASPDFAAVVDEKPEAGTYVTDATDETTDLPRMFTYKQDGNERYILISFHEGAGARFYRALSRVGIAHAPALLKPLVQIKNVVTSLATVYNPAFFLLRNPIKDLAGAGLNLTSEESAVFAAKVVARAPNAMAAILRAEMREARGKDPQDTKYARAYQEFSEAGGLTGWAEEMDYHKRVAYFQKALEAGKFSQAAQLFKGVLEATSSATENGTRLAAYMEARARGWSVQKAAFLGKSLTINFNRRGEWSPVTNVLWWFSNAGIQGNARTIEAARKRPHVWGGLVSSLAGAGFALAYWNRLLGDDDDRAGNRWEDTPTHEKHSYAEVLFPEPVKVAGVEVDRAKLPLPWVWNNFFALGVELEGVIFGKKSPGAATLDVAASMLDSWSPLGTAPTLGQFAAPSAADPFVQQWQNIPWYGGAIKPTNFSGQPESELYWDDANLTAVKVADFLNRATGGNSERPGAVSISPEIIEHWAGFLTSGTGKFAGRTYTAIERAISGEEVPMRMLPFLNDLFGAPDARATERRFRAQEDEVDIVRRELKAGEKSPRAWLAPLADDLAGFRRAIKRADEAGDEVEKNRLMREFSAIYEQLFEERRSKTPAIATK